MLYTVICWVSLIRKRVKCWSGLCFVMDFRSDYILYWIGNWGMLVSKLRVNARLGHWYAKLKMAGLMCRTQYGSNSSKTISVVIVDKVYKLIFINEWFCVTRLSRCTNWFWLVYHFGHLVTLNGYSLSVVSEWVYLVTDQWLY